MNATLAQLPAEVRSNRADEKREVIANLQWQTVQEEDGQNRELLQLSQQIPELTKAVHAATASRTNEVAVTSSGSES